MHLVIYESIYYKPALLSQSVESLETSYENKENKCNAKVVYKDIRAAC